MSSTSDKSRDQIIKSLVENLDSFSTDNLLEVSEYVSTLKSKRVATQGDTKTDMGGNPEQSPIKIEKVKRAKAKQYTSSDREIIALKIMNDLLTALGKTNITTIVNFSIMRTEIMDQKAIDSISGNYDYAFKSGMPKGTCLYHNRNRIKSYHLSFIKYLVKWVDSNYNFECHNYRRNRQSDTKYYVSRGL